MILQLNNILFYSLRGKASTVNNAIEMGNYLKDVDVDVVK